MAGEGAAAGAFGFELGFSASGAFAFGLGECAGRGELCLAAVAEAVTFTGGVGAGLGRLVAGVGFGLAGSADLSIGTVPGLGGSGERVVAFAGAAVSAGAGSGGLLTGAIGDGGDLRGGVAAQLGELARRGAGAVGGVLRGCAGGGGVITGGSEGLGEGLCFLAGFGFAGGRGDGGGFGAAAGGFGDLGADGGGIQAGGLLCRSACVHDGLTQHRLQGGERISAAGDGGRGCGWDAGVVVVAAGAVIAAELPGPAAAGCGQRGAAARAPADDGGWLVMTGAFLSGCPGKAFLFISDQR